MLDKIETRADLAIFADEIRAETNTIKQKRMRVQYMLYLKDIEVAELMNRVGELTPTQAVNEMSFIKMKLQARVTALIS